MERHLAQALRIYPGRVNLSMCIVGQPRDWYSFSLQGSGSNWDAALYTADGPRSLLDPASSGTAVRLHESVYLEKTSLLMLALRPPHDCGEGEVQVHVEQRSMGKTAVVEFSLDPRAAGPGCFIV